MRIPRFVMLCAAVVLALAVRGCYTPDQPVCNYRCDTSADNNGHCPWDYECRADGYCHLKGSTGMCPFSMPDMSAVPDMSMAPPPDMATSPDTAAPPDLAHNDF